MVVLENDVLEQDDLNETDEKILRLLSDGRCSPSFLAGELDRQQPYVSQRLKRLLEHGHVERVDRGLYELSDSPLSEREKRASYRERALEHYGKECDVCGGTDNIVVHHRDGDRSNNDLDNLIPLCERCHGKVHGRSEEIPGLVRELGYKPVPDEHTTIQVSDELADELHGRKERGDNYEDVIWRLIDAGEPADQRDTPDTPEPTATPTASREPVSSDARDTLREELAGSGECLERRVDAIVTMYDVLRERGEAEKSELLDAVDVDATDYASRDSVWANMVKGKDTLRALPGVETPSTGRTTWRYTKP